MLEFYKNPETLKNWKYKLYTYEQVARLNIIEKNVCEIDVYCSQTHLPVGPTPLAATRAGKVLALLLAPPRGRDAAAMAGPMGGLP